MNAGAQTQSQTPQDQLPGDALPTPAPLAGAACTAEPQRAARWLQVCHETLYDYGAPVELAQHVARLRPRETPSQTVHGWTLQIDPAPDVGPDDRREVHESADSWGNWRHTFSHTRVHARLRVTSRFRAAVLPAPLLAPLDSPPWEEVAEGLRYHVGATRSDAVEFTLASPYAPRADELAAFARSVFTPERPLLDAALALNHHVHSTFEYKPFSTSVATGALQAFKLRKGVCQDFAHVMIGALRSLGLAARYVSGYLLTRPPPGQPRMIGADASHAWVMVWCPAHGWVALDPTNDVVAGNDHVTLAWGRDYGDVAPLRGVIRGGGRAQPAVAVTVEPVARP